MVRGSTHPPPKGTDIKKRRKKHPALPDTRWHDLVDAHRHDVSIDGTPVHLIDIGQGPPVLLIHGFADSSYCWHANAEAFLNLGFRLLILDQPGFGRSAVPRKPYRFTIDSQAQRVLDAAATRTTDPLIVVGHSMGGAMAMLLAHRFPDRVKTTVAVAPLCRKPWRQVLAKPGIHSLVRFVPRRVLVRKTLRRLVYDPDSLSRTVVLEYTRAARRRDFFRNTTALARQFFSPAFFDLFDHPDRIAGPLLLIWGEHDPWVPVRWGRTLHEAIPHATFTAFPDAGHMVHQERPDAFITSCRMFLQSMIQGSDTVPSK